MAKPIPVVIYRHTCTRCRAKFMNPSSEGPTACPRCKNEYWNKPRMKKRYVRTKVSSGIKRALSDLAGPA